MLKKLTNVEKAFWYGIIASWHIYLVWGQGIIIIPPTSSSPAVVTPTPNPNCKCVDASSCADGAGTIDPRVLNSTPGQTCTPPQRFCCNIITTPMPTTPPTACGVQPLIPFPSFTPVVGQASYSEYPWMAILLDGETYISGGVLIDSTTVLTVAHKVHPLPALVSGLKVRVGDFIRNAATEPQAAVDVAVSTIRVHPQYTTSNLANDIAILKLAAAVDFTANPHIRPICLPASGASFVNQRCYVSGYGASSFVNGVYSQTLREVDVPIINGSYCQTQFRATRLGSGFVLNQQAFVCAGSEPGKDACTGDGGSPLACLSGTQWVLAGLVSWGIGCGDANIPGAYTNIPNYVEWINNNRA